MIRPEGVANLTAHQQRELLQELLRQRAAGISQFPMSVQQQGLWYDFRRDASSTAFNVSMPARVRSEVDVDAFRRAIDRLVDRHASLRTTFSDSGATLIQQVHEELRPEFRVIGAGGKSDDEIRQLVAEQTSRPFDLENGPMLRLVLFRRRADDWIIVAITHHIVVDFWSLVLLLSEMRELYMSLVSDREIVLAPAPNNYASLVEQQRRTLEGPRGETLRQYWRSQLEGSSHVTELPTDFIRPQHFSHRAETVPLELERDVTERMEELAKACGATFPALVLAVLQTLIHQYTGQSSFLIGSPFSGRLQREYEQTVGFFVNMLPLRADVSGELTFVQLVQRAAQTLVDALEHEDLPLTEIVRELEVPRDTSRTPLFQVCCTFEKSHLKQEQGRAAYLFPAEAQRANFGGLQQESFSVPVQTCHYDIEFLLERGDDGLRGMICYCRDLFERETMQTLAGHFRQLAEQLLQSPSRPLADISWKSSSPQAQRPVASDADTSRLMLDSIDRIAEQDPARIALSSPDRTWTYKDLADAAEAIARSLIRRGIGPGSYVPVVGKQGPEVIPALLGVIRSGAAVVPIDAGQPAVALADLIDDTGAELIIAPQPADWQRPTAKDGSPVEVVTIDELIEEGSGESFPIDPLGRGDLCYLIYTSGSSGRPKGVMIEHAAIDNTLRWRSENVPVGHDDRVLILLSHQFDAGLGLILSSLVQGAALVWSDQPASDVDAIIDRILRESITVLPAIPALLSLIMDHPRSGQCTSLRQLWTGGEAMSSDLPQRLEQRFGLPLWNFYGPTEAAIEAAAMNVSHHDSRRIVPIGGPVSNTEILVLDSNRRPLPTTVPGELAICGPGLARGYLGLPGLTAEKFPRLSDGRRVFLTGDRGRQRVDGCYEFLGRTDHQVKLGGYRIELEEIEQVLRSCPSVGDAAVKVHESSSRPACLIAYVTPCQRTADTGGEREGAGHDVTIHQVQRFVAARLPAYKRPRRCQLLDSMPKTSSGKIDRQQLPDPCDQELDHPPQLAPRTPLEQHLADAWGEMLSLASVGIHQDFFELGGTSLQAAMMASQLSDDLGLHVPTSLLFDLADVSRLAERLVELHRDELAIRFGKESVTIYQDQSSSSRPVSPVHSLIADFRDAGPLAQPDSVAAHSSSAPIFMIHPPGGIVVCYRELAGGCGEDQPFYAIRSRGLHGEEALPETVEEMAADYVAALKTVAPVGPYQIGGWSLGGIVAYEVARQLLAAGDSVERLILLDTSIPKGASDLVDGDENPNAGLEYGLELTLEELGQLEPDEVLPFLWQHAKKLGVLDDDTPVEVVDRALQDLQHLFHHHVDVIGQYAIEPLPAAVPVLLVRPHDVPMDVITSEDRGWSAIVSDLRVEFVAGHHHSMVQPPGVDEIASLLS